VLDVQFPGCFDLDFFLDEEKTMKVWKSYFAGLKEATTRPKMILLLWIINFLFSSLIFYIVFDVCCTVVGSTLAAESLVEKMDYYILLDALFHHGGQMSLIFTVAMILIVLYMPVSLLLKGGILHTLRTNQDQEESENPQKFLPLFFQGAGKFFGRFFRLWIYSLMLWLVFLLFQVVINPIAKLLTNNGYNERMLVYVYTGRIIISLIIVLLIKMIMDYTRIRIVVGDSTRVFRSFMQTLRYVFNNLGKSLALFYLLFFTGILVMILLWKLKSSVPSTSVSGSVLGFLIGQIVIYVRSWTNVTFQAGQLRFYR
jgi:hypothetical protein